LPKSPAAGTFAETPPLATPAEVAEYLHTTTAALVESLRRGSDIEMQEAAAAIKRLAAVPTDPGSVLNEIPLLRMRALLARAHGDEAAYRDYRDRYPAMATSLGFEGHIPWAEAMP